jgi:pimeloyl-ACP methyl ester carboxylesterase
MTHDSTSALRSLPIHVEDSGGAGPPLVFLHGYGANRATWRPWLPALRARHRCITVDLQGFGEAPIPNDAGWTLWDLARPIGQLIDALDLRDVTLVGHSMGGGVALIAALELLQRARQGDPSRLAALVSVAGIAYRQKLPPFVRASRWPRLAEWALRLAPKERLVRAIYHDVVVRPEAVRPESIEAMARPLRRPGAPRALIRIARELDRASVHELVGRIPEIDVPVLCLWGAGDRVVPPAVGRRLAAEVANGRYVELERCGHLVSEECPTKSLAVLTDFIGDVLGRGAEIEA